MGAELALRANLMLGPSAGGSLVFNRDWKKGTWGWSEDTSGDGRGGGRLCVIDVASLDDAIDRARRSAVLEKGAIEVYPVGPHGA